MTRPRLATLLALTAVLAAGLAGAADAATYRGVVGPTKVIKLTNSRGAAVSRIPAGRHTFIITDRSRVHDFVLKRGRTIVRRTGISATGTFAWRRVRIVAGRYTFYCSTHSREMRGFFRVS